MLSWKEKGVLHLGEEPHLSPGWGLGNGVKRMPSKAESAGAGRAASMSLSSAFLANPNTPPPLSVLQFKGPFE